MVKFTNLGFHQKCNDCGKSVDIVSLDDKAIMSLHFRKKGKGFCSGSFSSISIGGLITRKEVEE